MMNYWDSEPYLLSNVTFRKILTTSQQTYMLHDRRKTISGDWPTTRIMTTAMTTPRIIIICQSNSAQTEFWTHEQNWLFHTIPE